MSTKIYWDTEFHEIWRSESQTAPRGENEFQSVFTRPLFDLHEIWHKSSSCLAVKLLWALWKSVRRVKYFWILVYLKLHLRVYRETVCHFGRRERGGKVSTRLRVHSLVYICCIGTSQSYFWVAVGHSMMWPHPHTFTLDNSVWFGVWETKCPCVLYIHTGWLTLIL